MRTLIFDTETTGLPAAGTHSQWGHTHSSDGQPRFVELAWVKYDNDNMAEENDIYVYPNDFSMPDDTAQYTGISTDRLLSEGKPEGSILDAFMVAVRKSDILVGHNISYDIGVIRSRLKDLCRDDDTDVLVTKPVVCTMRTTVNYCALPKVAGKTYDYDGEYKYPRLGELHTILFGEGFDGAHGALADTKATARCYFELKRLRCNLNYVPHKTMRHKIKTVTFTPKLR